MRWITLAVLPTAPIWNLARPGRSGSGLPADAPATLKVFAPGDPTDLSNTGIRTEPLIFTTAFDALHLATLNLVPRQVTIGADDLLHADVVGGGSITLGLDADYQGGPC
jgi:hypothetical protein